MTWTSVGVFADGDCEATQMCFSSVPRHADVPARLLVRAAGTASSKRVVLKKSVRAGVGEDASLNPAVLSGLGNPQTAEFSRAGWLTAVRYTPGALADVFLALAGLVGAIGAFVVTLTSDEKKLSLLGLVVALVALVTGMVRTYRDLEALA